MHLPICSFAVQECKSFIDCSMPAQKYSYVTRWDLRDGGWGGGGVEGAVDGPISEDQGNPMQMVLILP